MQRSISRRPDAQESAAAQLVPSAQPLGGALDGFDNASLAELNTRAKLLQRLDRKYVLTTAQMLTFLQYAKAGFDALEIGGLRQFRYRSLYFDSRNFDCFFDHSKRRRKQVKVRYRHYVDHDLYFAEVKVRGFRQIMSKYRTPITRQVHDAGVLSDSVYQFCNNRIATHYSDMQISNLVRSLMIEYSRVTLVAKQASERITIDHGLSFSDEWRTDNLHRDRWIMEVKSQRNVSPVDYWLFSEGIRPVSPCSKYCMGISLIKFPHKNNRFRPILRRKFDKSLSARTRSNELLPKKVVAFGVDIKQQPEHLCYQ